MFEASPQMVPVVTLSMVLMLPLGFPSLTLSCPQPCACYFSTEVHCTFRSLTAVPAGIPKVVERINFGFNNIQSVSKELFDGLQRLELLMLHGNDIQSLPDKVFKNLKSLQALKMSYNKMTAITGYTFQGLVNLLRLHLDHNKIEFIQPGAFYGMTSLTLLHLEGNQLQQIHPNTFVTLSVLQHFKFSSIKHLYLSDNSIRTLPREMLGQMLQLESIYLQDNPWSCDCRLQWLLDWGKEAGDVVKCKKDRSNPRGRVCSVCSDPKQFSKKELFKLDSSELACTKPTIKSTLKKSYGNEWEADEGEDTSHENYQKPLGRMTLNLTDQQGNTDDLFCRINSMGNERHAQWRRLTEQDIAVNMTLSVKLTCPMNQESMERLWKLIAYYSETPVRLKKGLMLSKGPSSYQYRQVVDSDSYYYTDVRANIEAEPSWLMQDYVNIKLDRKLTTANDVILIFSLYLSQQFPIRGTTRDKTDWVLIKVSDKTKLVHVVVTGTMLQLKCQVVASENPSIQWVLPDGSQVLAPNTSKDNRISVFNTGRLVVKAVEHHDAGLYRCIGSVKDDTDTMTYRVVVQPAKLPASQVRERGITVPYGDTISLPCTASSVPDAQLTWILPNSSVLAAPINTTTGSVMANGSLVIRGGHDGNSGHYRCIATNRYGLDVLTVNVAVIKKLPSQIVKKGNPSPKFYLRAGYQKEKEGEASGEETAHESQKQVTYNVYTGGPPNGRRNLHADGAQDDSKVDYIRDIRLRKGFKRGRGMLAAEGRRRLDSRRRINMTNKKIDPQKWADILAKVRRKSIPRPTVAPLRQVYTSTFTSPITPGRQVPDPTVKLPARLSPMAGLDVEDSSGNGDLSFSEDELIHVGTSHNVLVGMPETATLQENLVLELQPVEGHRGSSEDQSTPPPSPENTTKSTTVATFIWEPEILELVPTPIPPVEVHPSEATGKFIDIESTQEEGGSDVEQVSVLKTDADEYIVGGWVAKSLDHPEVKLRGVESMVDVMDVDVNSENDTTYFRGDLSIASETITTMNTPEATTVSTRDQPLKGTTELVHTTTARITTIATSIITQADNISTASIIVPTSSGEATISRPMESSTMTTTTTGANTNTRAAARRRWPYPGSRRYSRKRRPGRRYRLNRLRQNHNSQPKAKANDVSTTWPAVKVAPKEMNNLVGGQVKVNTTAANKADSMLSTAAYHKISPQQLTTERPELKSAHVLTILKSPHLGTSPSLVQHRSKLQGPNSTPTLQATQDTARSVPEAANSIPHIHQSKTLHIQSHYELRPKFMTTTASPLMVNSIGKPPDSPESSKVPVSSRTTTTVDIPVEDNRKTSDVILSPLVPSTELPITKTVTSTSKSVTNYLTASTTASNIQGSSNTQASNTVVKIPTTTVLEPDPESPVLHPDDGISTVQDHRGDIPPEVPSLSYVDTSASLSSVENRTPDSKGIESVVPGVQPTVGALVTVPVLHSQITFTEHKAVLSPDVNLGGVTSQERDSPTQLNTGAKGIEQDRIETMRTSESNAIPDRFIPKHHTNGWQQLKEIYTGKTNNLTWIVRGGWKPSASLRPIPIPNKDTRRKSPKYILVETTQKMPGPAVRDKPPYSVTGAPSVDTSKPNLKVFETKGGQSTPKPDEPFIKLPVTLVPPIRTIPVIFNKPANKFVADLGNRSRTNNTNYALPMKESTVQKSNISRGNQKLHFVQIPIQFTNVKTSPTAYKTTTHPVPVPTQTTISTPAATERLFRNASENRRVNYSLDLANVERDTSSVALPSPSFRTTRTKPKIITSSPLPVSVKAEMDAYLPCEAYGEPKPIISWSKVSTGAVVTAGSNLARFEVFDNGTLGIHETEVQDRGQYLCVAQNPHGTDQMLVTLVVLAQLPRITGARYRDATVYLGEPFTAECRAAGSPAPHVTWLLPGGRTLRAPGDTGSGVTLALDGTLDIGQTTFSDRGVYKCIAGNTVGADTTTVRLHVSALPPRILEQRTENISAAPGRSVHAHCTTKAAPAANVRWILVDGMQIRPSQFIHGNLFVFPNGTLYIRNLSQREVGTYECVATNIVGIARRTVGIGIQRHSAMAKITLSSPQRVDISYGSILHLDCEAAGEPGPRILWRLPSKLLVDSRYSYSKRIKVYNNGTLMVQLVTDKDAGDYLCIARNNMGDDFMVLKVNVMMKPAKIEYKQDANHKVMYGKDLKVDCIASGLPDPEISWGLPDGTMVNSVMQSDDSGTRMRRYIVFDNGTLYFNEVGLKDEGDYTCYAVNQIGKDEMKVNVKVLAEPPTFKGHAPSLVEVAYGEVCSIKCEAKGEPTPWITWHSPTNKLISPSSKYQVSTDGTLFIQKVQRSDSGNYTCTARNTAGEKKRVITVQVIIEPPSINGQRRVNTVVKDTAMRDTRKLMDCKAEGIPIPRVMWVLPENVIVTAPYYGDRIQVHRNGTLDIRSMKQSDGVQFVCIARNEGGEARLTVQLEVQNNLEKPSFTNPLNAGVAIVIGNSVNLNCSTRGNPTPEITWILPNGNKLMSGQQLPKMYHGRDGTLHISSPSATEAGSYRCIARNTVGSVERFVTLEIGHKPEMRNRYTSLVKVLPGESMRLDCVTGGSPLPQLSWILPSGVVLSRPQTVGRFSLLQNGTLIVREASVYDRGTYSCKAVSELGLTLMSVAVIVIAYPPRITNGPTPVTYARHGSSVQLNCMAMGIPRAEISWELPDRTRLTAAFQARLIGNKFLHPQGSLILQNPSNRDTGFYKCTAKNLLGSDSKITYVHVF
ncbi:matrix-remodeling-associated protein 5 [Pristis pectinata]|uniref:matrix-remodeling-associated protein 5 n=1 Tax=Pristis pectinata TaxID=685728 RepID=UPI00223D363D|nr:matrix-remodeling-associated protein 5 [Pristis pectinata]XP_051882109.1 matrix-remodeling-associated protein 5 [Pristis pectinata]XP_051882110.1 matrix-remodeling-associated protein 5 [Pristis pectinata]XP_051882111.1 matrix-remodeling-associated protein 5 [Pristis pectinata]